MAVIALLILVSVKIITFINNYKIFQSRNDDFFDYAVIDYSTLKRLYQINPDGYELASFGQLYRINYSNGYAIKEVRIVFKTIFDYIHFEIDKKYNKKTSRIAKRRKQEEQGLSKLRDLAQQDIDNLRAKLDAEFEQEKKKTQEIATNMRQPAFKASIAFPKFIEIDVLTSISMSFILAVKALRYISIPCACSFINLY